MNTPTPPPPIADLLTRNCIAVDIETVANPAVLDLPGVMPEFKAAANVKDPIKIANQIEAKEEKWRNEAGLSPDYGKIVCVCLHSDSVEHVFKDDYKDGSEADILRQTWDVLKDWQEITTFNGKSFDAFWLVRRSWYHGIKPSTKYDFLPYRSQNHYDLRLILSHGNKTAKGKLKQFVKIKLGIDIEGSGADVQAQYDAGLIDEIADHCLSSGQAPAWGTIPSPARLN